MELALDCLIVVAFIAGLQLLAWVFERGLIGRAFRRARVRWGRRVPPGFYRIEGQIGFTFGDEDTELALRLPLRIGEEGRTLRYVGVTDASTVFTVNREPATPDAVLEAYDDELGPIEVQVNETGRIAEFGIAAEKPRKS